MKKIILLILILGIVVSCSNNTIEKNNQGEVETETDMNVETGFIEQIDDSFIDEEEYIEIGELI